MEGVIDSTEGDKVTVKISLATGPDKEEKRVLKKDQVQQVTELIFCHKTDDGRCLSSFRRH